MGECTLCLAQLKYILMIYRQLCERPNPREGRNPGTGKTAPTNLLNDN